VENVGESDDQAVRAVRRVRLDGVATLALAAAVGRLEVPRRLRERDRGRLQVVVERVDEVEDLLGVLTQVDLPAERDQMVP
jgi:hypothetical protein